MSIEPESSFDAFLSSIQEQLNQAAWFQQIKEKWQELDHKVRLGIRLGSLALVLMFFLVWIGGTYYKVSKLKAEVSQLQELLNTVRNANEELGQLKNQTPNLADKLIGGDGNQAATTEKAWNDFFVDLLNQSLISPAHLNVSSESPGKQSEGFKEVLFDLKLNKINIKQIIAFTTLLESTSRPIKVRNLSLHTHPDLSGYLDAVISVSGFTLAQTAY